MTKIKSLIYNTGPGAGGSGCRRLFFFILIHPNKACKIDWEIRAIFIINLHSKDSAPLAAGELELIKSSLGVGRISKQGKDSLQYLVTSVKELEVIIDHFDKYPSSNLGNCSSVGKTIKFRVNLKVLITKLV